MKSPKIKITFKQVYESPSEKRFFRIQKIVGAVSVFDGGRELFVADVVDMGTAVSLSRSYNTTTTP